jgi:folylpolyglutamate synthase/dihydropteroate synthase
LALRRCAYAHPRSRGEADWPADLRRWPWSATITEALAATRGDVCVTGSFYLAGEALTALGATGQLPG